MIYDNALTTKADKSNTYLKTETDDKFTTSNLLITTKVDISSVALEGVFVWLNL